VRPLLSIFSQRIAIKVDERKRATRLDWLGLSKAMPSGPDLRDRVRLRFTHFHALGWYGDAHPLSTAALVHRLLSFLETLTTEWVRNRSLSRR
jgi:hypothetical protein